MALNPAHVLDPISSRLLMLAAFAGVALWMFAPWGGRAATPAGARRLAELPPSLKVDGTVQVESHDNVVTRLVVPLAVRGNDGHRPDRRQRRASRAETAMSDDGMRPRCRRRTPSVWLDGNGDNVLDPGEHGAADGRPSGAARPCTREPAAAGHARPPNGGSLVIEDVLGTVSIAAATAELAETGTSAAGSALVLLRVRRRAADCRCATLVTRPMWRRYMSSAAMLLASRISPSSTRRESVVERHALQHEVLVLVGVQRVLDEIGGRVDVLVLLGVAGRQVHAADARQRAAMARSPRATRAARRPRATCRGRRRPRRAVRAATRRRVAVLAHHQQAAVIVDRHENDGHAVLDDLAGVGRSRPAGGAYRRARRSSGRRTCGRIRPQGSPSAEP